MDIDLYRELFKRYKLIFLFVFIISLGLVLLFNYFQAPVYEGSVSISITQKPEKNYSTGEYQFSEYYNLKGSEELAKYFSFQLTDPGTVNEIFAKAKLGLPNKSLKSIRRLFTIKSAEIAAVNIEFESGNKDDTFRALQSAQEVMQTRLEILQSKNMFTNFVITSSPIYVQQMPKDLPLTITIGALLGIFLGFFILLILSLNISEKKS